jgi:hypothetical protein
MLTIFCCAAIGAHGGYAQGRGPRRSRGLSAWLWHTPAQLRGESRCTSVPAA